MVFTMDTGQFDDWVKWMNSYGYDWFTIPLDRFGGSKKDTDIRLVTTIIYSYEAFDKVTATVAGEFFDA